MKRLDEKDIRRIVVLTGTRRVGKTTIQYQMIEALLQRGISPQKIVFISMDHPMLKLSDFNDILECYHENIYAEQDVYYFFDEIQYAQELGQMAENYLRYAAGNKCSRHRLCQPGIGKGQSGKRRRTLVCYSGSYHVFL